MPLLRCVLSPYPGLPTQSRFWDAVRVDSRTQVLSLDPFQDERDVLRELQRRGVIGGKALLENFHIEKAVDEDLWRLLYVLGKKPTILLEIKPPPDRQLDLFA
ncbi:MAG: hypothetical protein GX751_06015 [Desulfuromonadaceae bacterium]|nr:hypothetical protein [Desulfuromonadaceae bacterium]